MKKLTSLLLLTFCACFTCLAQVKEMSSIIPKPLLVKAQPGTFVFGEQTQLSIDLKDNAPAQFLKTYLANHWKYPVRKMAPKNTSNATKIVITDKDSQTLTAEGYELNITPKLITIKAKGAGVFYAIQSLIQLFPDRQGNIATLPCGQIVDQPRFGYRGLMLDVSRHFFTVGEIKNLLDLMASYKLNRFHWHLTDDQGWRIEIKSYPKLTEVGAWRVPRIDFGGEAPQPGEKATDGGFYTQDQIREVIRYASARNIEIMPEIDVPGHSMAAVAAYPALSVTKNPEIKVNPGSSFAKWFPTGGYEMYVDNTLNPTDEKVYQFLDGVFEEVAALFPYEYIHIGGDECFKGFWEKDATVKGFMLKNGIKTSHDLQVYFTKRVSKIISSKGKKAIGWDEIDDGQLGDGVAIMNRFGEKGALSQTKRKVNIILAPGNNGLYFDYAQSYSDMEPINHGGFSPLWKSYEYNAEYNKMSTEDKKYILGVEACIWTEGISTIGKLQYMMLPRLFGLAETAWTAENNKNYAMFTEKAVAVHLEKLDRQGYNYRVPTAFNYTDTTLIGNQFTFELKEPIPGSKIYYTLNNRFPGEADHLYTTPIVVKLTENKKTILKTIVVAPSGKRSVLTRTIMYNPVFKKSVSKSLEPGLKYKVVHTLEAKIDTGVVLTTSLPTSLTADKSAMNRFEGYVRIPKDGYYEFSADQAQLVITVAGAKVFDGEKPYPKFDKPDFLFLQEGYHPIKLEQSRLSGSIKLFLKESKGTKVELTGTYLYH
jgi:hexosaminidase